MSSTPDADRLAEITRELEQTVHRRDGFRPLGEVVKPYLFVIHGTEWRARRVFEFSPAWRTSPTYPAAIERLIPYLPRVAYGLSDIHAVVFITEARFVQGQGEGDLERAKRLTAQRRLAEHPDAVNARVVFAFGLNGAQLFGNRVQGEPARLIDLRADPAQWAEGGLVNAMEAFVQALKELA